MEARIIARGLSAGAVGGTLAFLFARVFLEPVIGRALAAHDHGSHEHGVELFGRGVQANVGMGFGVMAFAVAMGALLAVVITVAYGRFADIAVRPLAAVTAGAMLLCLAIVPALKYPPGPPGVSLEETIRQRTLLYLLMVVCSAALLVAAVYLVCDAHPGGDVGDDRPGVRRTHASPTCGAQAHRRPGVSDVVRLTLVAHGSTDAMVVGRFPSDEPLNTVGRRQIGECACDAGAAFTAPETRARETAGLLGLRGLRRASVGGSRRRVLGWPRSGRRAAG